MSTHRNFIKVHDSIEDHPKVIALSDAAFRAMITGWGWCRRHKTDGWMTTQVFHKRCTAKVRRELVEVGIVHDHGDKVEWHDYLDHQQSAAEQDALSEKRRRAGQAGGKARAKQVLEHPASNEETEKRREEKRETPSVSSSEAAPSDPPRTDVEGLCRYFASRLTANGVKATITEKWRTEARLLLDRDERDKDELRAVIDWATTDPFWRSNVLSIPKLRAKYDQLRLAMQREQGVEPVRKQEPSWMR